MKYLKNLVVVSLFFYIPGSVNAWGTLGHRIVGEIAESYLTKNAKKEIQKILGFESIAMSANWADFIKSDASYRYLSTWHYVNLKSGLSFDEVQSFFAKDTAVDAYTKMNFLAKELKTNRLLPPDTKRFYLRLLIHFAGDVHQPMHLGRPDDRGGNGVRVRWFSDSSNLHQVWDSRLIDFQQLSYTEYANAINHPTKEQLSAWQKQTFVQQLWDTYQVTEKIYAGTRANERLDYDYDFKFIGMLNEQLLKGGVHLAALLNDIYG